MFCHKCGNEISSDAEYCSKCGAKLEKANNEENIQKQKNTKVVKMSKARVGIIGAGILLVLCIIGSLGNKDSVKEDEEVAIAEEIEVSDLKNVKQAEKVFETWLKEHPLDCKPEYELLDEYGTWGNGRESYVYALGIDGIEYRLYVDREDGSMFVEDEMEVMAIDYWYDAFYGDGVEEVYDTSLNIDYDLVGRWRNQDGGMLEFDEFGNIVNIDFECWSVFDNPNYITWEAADGRVTCYSAFCYDKSYEIATTGENGDQELKFDRNGVWYLRDEEVMGEGLIGRWINKGWEVLTCQFNADGSGWWNDKYPISWYVYEAENEGVITNRVEYTIYDSAYFDYHVAGDILTVYLSNGSRMYTKVSN